MLQFKGATHYNVYTISQRAIGLMRNTLQVYFTHNSKSNYLEYLHVSVFKCENIQTKL